MKIREKRGSQGPTEMIGYHFKNFKVYLDNGISLVNNP